MSTAADIRRLRNRKFLVLEHAVLDARRIGLTWDQIGAAFGVTRQWAWSRFWRVARDTGPQTDWASRKAQEHELAQRRRVWPSTFKPLPPFRVERFEGYLILPDGRASRTTAVDLHVVDGRGRTCRIFDRHTQKHWKQRVNAAERYRAELQETFG